jgi:hypothetical protein
MQVIASTLVTADGTGALLGCSGAAAVRTTRGTARSAAGDPGPLRSYPAGGDEGVPVAAARWADARPGPVGGHWPW